MTTARFRIGDTVRVREGVQCSDCERVVGRIGTVVTFIDGIGVAFEGFVRGHNLNVLPAGTTNGWWCHTGHLELVEYGAPMAHTIAANPILDEPNTCTDDDLVNMVTCYYCGEDVPGDSTFEVEDNRWCEQCTSRYTFFCEQCGDTRMDRYSVTCEDCGGIMCEDCSQEHDCEPPEQEHIHSYNYNPQPFVFHGNGPRYFGVELEIDKGGRNNDNAARLLHDWSDDEQLFYIKEDGSLDDGFEIVTHPASLAFHRESFPWAQVTKLATEMGYSSHDTTTCGLHVHVSRNGTGGTRQAQDVALSKLIFLFWRHWVPLTEFSRRHMEQLTQWADINYKDTDAHLDQVEPGNEHPSLQSAKRYRGKYAAINTEHLKTLEIRIFRGTLRPETILASIELVDLMVDLSIQWSFTQVVESTWGQVVEQVGPNRPELSLYLASKWMVKTNGAEN